MNYEETIDVLLNNFDDDYINYVLNNRNISEIGVDSLNDYLEYYSEIKKISMEVLANLLTNYKDYDKESFMEYVKKAETLISKSDEKIKPLRNMFNYKNSILEDKTKEFDKQNSEKLSNEINILKNGGTYEELDKEIEEKRNERLQRIDDRVSNESKEKIIDFDKEFAEIKALLTEETSQSEKTGDTPSEDDIETTEAITAAKEAFKKELEEQEEYNKATDEEDLTEEEDYEQIIDDEFFDIGDKNKENSSIISSNQPSNTQPNQPSNIQPNQPSNTQPNQSSNTQPNQLSNTQSNQPSNTQPNQPSNTQPNQPSNTQPNQPSNTQSNQPSNTQPNQPSNTQPNQPGNTQPNNGTMQRQISNESLEGLMNSGVLPRMNKSDLIKICNSLGIKTNSLDYEPTSSELERLKYDREILNAKLSDNLLKKHNARIVEYENIIKSYKDLLVTRINIGSFSPNYIQQIQKRISDLEKEKRMYESKIKGINSKNVESFYALGSDVSNFSSQEISTVLDQQQEKNNEKLKKQYEKLDEVASQNYGSSKFKKIKEMKMKRIEKRIKQLRDKQSMLNSQQIKIVNKNTEKYIDKIKKRQQAYIKNQNKVQEFTDSIIDMQQSEQELNNEINLITSDVSKTSSKVNQAMATVDIKLKEAKIQQLRLKQGLTDRRVQFSRQRNMESFYRK